jgi:hypothetical protein
MDSEPTPAIRAPTDEEQREVLNGFVQIADGIGLLTRLGLRALDPRILAGLHALNEQGWTSGVTVAAEENASLRVSFWLRNPEGERREIFVFDHDQWLADAQGRRPSWATLN